MHIKLPVFNNYPD